METANLNSESEEKSLETFEKSKEKVIP